MFEFESAFINKIIGMIRSGNFAKKFKLMSGGTSCNWISYFGVFLLVSSLTFSICARSSTCGKGKHRFYRVICNGYNRLKAVEFHGGEIEMWKKNSNTGATRIEEVSNAFG